MNARHHKYVVIGGGIAGVTCLETLCHLAPGESVLLISSSPLVKVINNYQKVTDSLHRFDVEERPLTSLPTSPSVSILHDTVVALDVEQHRLTTQNTGHVTFGRLCISTGASPKLLCAENEFVIGIRDTESMSDFQQRLASARRVVVVGNGGIATELVYQIDSCDIVWAIKDDSIVSAFVDCGAGAFFLKQLAGQRPSVQEPSKRLRYTITGGYSKGEKCVSGSALGPDWLNNRQLRGSAINQEQQSSVHVEFCVEVTKVWSHDDFVSSEKTCTKPQSIGASSSCRESTEWPVYVELSNGMLYGCDFIVSATGVTPNSHPFSQQLSTGVDGGLQINDQMTTSAPCIYAAGDVATATWTIAPHWLQMRLWTQAHQQGHYAARCMVAHDRHEAIHMDFCFDLFAHVTKFFNFKVILLGRFNAQGLGDDHTLLLRVTDGVEYIKAVIQDGRMQGAVLIGDTDLEETFENLILNQTDLSRYGEELLDPNIDIDDYFD